MVTYSLLTVFSCCSMASYSPTILSEGLPPLGRDFWLFNSDVTCITTSLLSCMHAQVKLGKPMNLCDV